MHFSLFFLIIIVVVTILLLLILRNYYYYCYCYYNYHRRRLRHTVIVFIVIVIVIVIVLITIFHATNIGLRVVTEQPRCYRTDAVLNSCLLLFFHSLADRRTRSSRSIGETITRNLFVSV